MSNASGASWEDYILVIINSLQWVRYFHWSKAKVSYSFNPSVCLFLSSFTQTQCETTRAASCGANKHSDALLLWAFCINALTNSCGSRRGLVKLLLPPPAGFQWLFSLCSRSFSQEMKIRETRRLTLECALTSVAGYCQKLPIWYWLEGESLIRDEDDMKN